MLLFLFTTTQAQNFSLHGKINGLNNLYIFFSYLGYGNDRIWDSTLIKNNAFQFSGVLKGQAKCYITIRKDNRTNTDSAGVAPPFFIDASNMHITLKSKDFKKTIITGSRVQQEWATFHNHNQAINSKLSQLVFLDDSLNAMHNEEKDEKIAAAIEKKIEANKKNMQPLIDNINSLDKKFIATHLSGLPATILLERNKNIYDIKNLHYIFNQMPKANQQSPWGLLIQKYFAELLIGTKGTVAADFSAKELHGDSLKLSDYKGKYVLLDFWASWCMPCRAGNPELVKLYNEYKSYGIEFIGIASDDGHEDKWRAAIEKDGIGIWKQLLSGQDPKTLDKTNDIGKPFGINSLPSQILIGPDGKIIERFGDGGVESEQLSRVLKNIFTK